MKDVEYILRSTLYYASDLVGWGTICFTAIEEAAPKTLYVIKDSWFATGDLEGKEAEVSLIVHAHNQGVTLKSIPRIRHTEDVKIKGLNGHICVDTILNSRQDHSNDHP